jgi:hypothetical protein
MALIQTGRAYECSEYTVEDMVKLCCQDSEMNRIAKTCSLEASITGYPSPRGLCASFSPGVNIIGRALKAYQYQVVFRFVDLVRKQTGNMPNSCASEHVQ